MVRLRRRILAEHAGFHVGQLTVNDHTLTAGQQRLRAWFEPGDRKTPATVRPVRGRGQRCEGASAVQNTIVRLGVRLVALLRPHPARRAHRELVLPRAEWLQGPVALAERRPDVVEKMWPPAPLSVGRARRLLAVHLVEWGLPQLSDCAELVVSELVTNAVTHAHPPYGNVISTRFERLDAGVRIEVHDSSDNKPERRNASAEEESGRGLGLVDVLTGGHWGVSDRDGPGKMVWAVCTEADTDQAVP